MIMDERLEFDDSGSWNTQGTSGSVWVNTGDVVDLSVTSRMPSHGKPLYLVVLIEETNDGGGGTSGTINFRLVSDSTETPSTDTTPTVHWRSDTFAAGELVGGETRLVVPLPVGSPEYERFLGFQILYGTEEEDDLEGSAFLTFDPSFWVSKPDAANTNP